MRTEGPGSQVSAEQLLREAVAVDPAFASAWIHLAWTLQNQGKSPEEVRSCAETALRLADTTPDREKYFIRGSYFDMIGETEKAIAAYEALLSLYPDHTWAANNLCHLYDWQHDPSQLEKAVAVEARIADLRPRDFYWNSQAAITALFFKPDPAAEARFYGRAAALLTPKIRENNPDAVFIVLQPFDANWLVGEIAAANREIDRVAATIPSLSGQSRDFIAQATANAYLMLGRLEAAEDASRKINDSRAQNAMFAEIAFLRGDEAGFRDRLKSQQEPEPDNPPNWRTLVVLGARIGMTSDARRFVEVSERVPPPSPNMKEDVHTLRGEIARAQGRRAEAARELEAASEDQGEIVTSRYYLGMESLAEILTEQGDVSRAIEVLERRPDRFAAAGGGGAAYWLRNRLQLAKLYRRAGRIEDARAVETELSSLLAFADPDHPIKVELARLKN
jgi:tetratricopeptide (TPR) repeat protein